MASTLTFNVISAFSGSDSSGPSLHLIIQPLPTTVNGQSVASPYSTAFNIANPTQAQIAKYVTGAQIELTTDT